MIGVCPKCGTMHETTTESAFSPDLLDRMCVQCYRGTLDEAAATCAEARGDSAGAALIRSDAQRHWKEVDAHENVKRLRFETISLASTDPAPVPSPSSPLYLWSVSRLTRGCGNYTFICAAATEQQARSIEPLGRERAYVNGEWVTVSEENSIFLTKVEDASVKFIGVPAAGVAEGEVILDSYRDMPIRFGGEHDS